MMQTDEQKIEAARRAYDEARRKRGKVAENLAVRDMVHAARRFELGEPRRPYRSNVLLDRLTADIERTRLAARAALGLPSR